MFFPKTGRILFGTSSWGGTLIGWKHQMPSTQPSSAHKGNGGKLYRLKNHEGHLAITMIGNEIGELTGKTIGIRLGHHYGGPMKLERTIEAKGTVYGTEVTFIATTWAVERQHGGTYVKGHGIMMTRTGEKAEAQGSGISFPTKNGGWSARGVRYFQTGSAALKKLNDVAAVFEIEIAPDGSYKDKMWEWK